jgi:hypothetical protein
VSEIFTIVPYGRSDAENRYQMFESNMDEYLDEEVESVKLVFETVVKGWDHKEVSRLVSRKNIADPRLRQPSTAQPLIPVS